MVDRIGKGTTAVGLSGIVGKVHEAPKSAFKNFKATFMRCVNSMRRLTGVTTKPTVINLGDDIDSLIRLSNPATVAPRRDDVENANLVETDKGITRPHCMVETSEPQLQRSSSVLRGNDGALDEEVSGVASEEAASEESTELPSEWIVDTFREWDSKLPGEASGDWSEDVFRELDSILAAGVVDDAVSAAAVNPTPTEASTASLRAPKDDFQASVDGVNRLLEDTKESAKGRMSKVDHKQFKSLKKSLKKCLSKLENGRPVEKEKLSALGIELINMRLYAAGLEWAIADSQKIANANTAVNANNEAVDVDHIYDKAKVSIRQNVPGAWEDECTETLSRYDAALSGKSHQTVPKQNEGAV